MLVDAWDSGLCGSGMGMPSEAFKVISCRSRPKLIFCANTVKILQTRLEVGKEPQSVSSIPILRALHGTCLQIGMSFTKASAWQVGTIEGLTEHHGLPCTAFTSGCWALPHLVERCCCAQRHERDLSLWVDKTPLCSSCYQSADDCTRYMRVWFTPQNYFAWLD